MSLLLPSRMIGPRLPVLSAHSVALQSHSQYTLRSCFLCLRFMLQHDREHLTRYLLASDLQVWMYRLLIHSDAAAATVSGPL